MVNNNTCAIVALDALNCGKWMIVLLKRIVFDKIVYSIYSGDTLDNRSCQMM